MDRKLIVIGAAAVAGVVIYRVQAARQVQTAATVQHIDSIARATVQPVKQPWRAQQRDFGRVFHNPAPKKKAAAAKK